MENSATADSVQPQSAELSEIANTLSQNTLSWKTAGTILEHCVRQLWPDDMDADVLLPEVQHILDSEVAVLELLQRIRTNSDVADCAVRSACALLVRAASALHRTRTRQ